MATLEGKNILIVIPKDYYDEDQLDPVRRKLLDAGADVRVASPKFKEAVGMKNGRIMPDLLIVDAIEGITGDSYVTGGKGTRQIKGVFHGTVVIGGKGTRKYLWKEKLLRLLLIDRHKSQMVVGALGNAVICLGEAGLIQNVEVAAEQTLDILPELEKAAAILSDEDLVVYDRIVTARGAEAADRFADAMIEEVAKTPHK